MSAKSVMSLLVAMALASGCTDQVQPSPPPGGTWLPASSPERDEAIERQFRGFDMAMVETGYRFAELYWAGTEQNWPYAAYQAEKIQTAIERGLERRPARAASAGSFLDTTLPTVQEAIEIGDLGQFTERFEELRAACNSCHIAERMEFMNVVIPEQRTVPLGN
jgi:hypothetical protein